MMNPIRSDRRYQWAAVLIPLFLLLILALPRLTDAQSMQTRTPIPGGTISADTTWTVANSPYDVLGSITVADGATLTIEPGVELYWNSSGHRLTINSGASLAAAGTAVDPITFTSDTAAPGSWRGLYINSGGQAMLAHCEIGYAGSGFNEALYVASSAVSVTDCYIHHSNYRGIHLNGVDLTPVLTRVQVENSGYYAIYQNTINMTPTYSDLSISGHSNDAIVINGGTTDRHLTLVPPGVAGEAIIPYRIVGSSGVTIAGSQALTMTPGAAIHFTFSNRTLTVNNGAQLYAVGTADQPVIFGDNEADPGSWTGLVVNAGGQATLTHCQVNSAGGAALSGRALEIADSDVSVTDCLVQNSNRDGIWLIGAGLSPTLTRVQVHNNNGRAVFQNTVDMNPVYDELDFSGNDEDAIVSNGATINRHITLVPPGSAGEATIPYVIVGSTGVTIAASQALTMTPGVAIQFTASNRTLTVNNGARLYVVGTADQPVIFGDSEAASGSWAGLVVNVGSQATLAHCQINSAGGAALSGRALSIASSDVTVTDCLIQNSSRDGVNINGAGLSPTLTRLQIENNDLRAVYQNTADMTPTYNDLSVSGNGQDAIVIAGNASGNINRHITLTPPGSAGEAVLPYRYQGSATIAASQALTVTPGVEVQIVGGIHHRLTVNGDGRLRAVGTAANPVVFNGSSLTPGSWAGIYINSGGQVTLNHCHINYAGHRGGAATTSGAVRTASSDVSVTHCLIQQSAHEAITTNEAQPTIRFNQFVDNGFGVRNETPDFAVVDARANWWGDASGPYHPTLNPDGLGNEASDGVLFDPWLLSPITDLPIITPRRGGDIGDVTVSIFAPEPLFEGDASARLSRAGQPDIPINLLAVYESGQHAIGKVDLRQKELGLWDLIISPAEGNDVIVGQAFTVEEGVWPNVISDILGRDTLRVGRASQFIVTANNIGNVNALGPIILVKGLPPDTTVQADPRFSLRPDILDIEGFAESSPVIQSETETGLILHFPEIPPGITEYGFFTITVPIAADFDIELHTISPSDFIDPAGMVEGTMTPVYNMAYPAPVNSVQHNLDAFHEIIDMLNETGTETTVWDHGRKWFSEKKSCMSASEQRADNLRALRDTPGSAFEGWKVGEVWYQVHYLNIIQDPETGTFYYVDNYTFKPIIKQLIHLNPDEEDVSIWEFRPIYSPIKLKLREMGEWDPHNDPPPPDPPPLPEFPYSLLDPNQFRKKPVRTVQSMDPNEKIGPMGYGDQQALTGLGPLNYAIFFENVMTATAPAQEVLIIDALDLNTLDLETFQVGPISFGGNVVATPPPGLQQYSTVVDLRPDQELLVAIDVDIDLNSGVATWLFTSLDPATNEPPEDPFAGFLPPNVNPPEGEGFVLFSILPRPDVTTGVEIQNGALIYFDDNEPLATNVWSNLIDMDPPVSQVEPLPAKQPSVFTVSWSGTDLGVGIDRYSIYVSHNGDPFEPWLLNTITTTAVYTATESGTYAFYAIARDGAGNIEAPKDTAEAVTTVGSGQHTLFLPVIVRAPAQTAQVENLTAAAAPDQSFDDGLVAGPDQPPVLSGEDGLLASPARWGPFAWLERQLRMELYLRQSPS